MNADPVTILAIDPGTEESALVLWDGCRITDHAKLKNSEILDRLCSPWLTRPIVWIEMVASFGMPVGREVFETCVWIGKFIQAHESKHNSAVLLATRHRVKLHLCHSARAKDSNVRQALVDRFGGKGTKAAPGITYGLAGDEWQAFALAVYAFDTINGSVTEEAKAAVVGEEKG